MKPAAQTAVTFRVLESSDLIRVGQLVRESFDPALVPYMVATQHGWPDFVEVWVRHRRQFDHQMLMVAEIAGEVVAFSDFRCPGDGTGFLSYICVDPAARGRGIARDLLGACVRDSGDLTSVGLDVFEDNLAARALYERLGFVVDGSHTWWRRPVGRAQVPERLTLAGLPHALASLARYGFCELNGTFAGRDVRCGRMGTSVLRLFTADDFDEVDRPGALAVALASEFPEIREAFAVLPSEWHPASDDAEAFNRVLRMSTTKISTLLGEA